MRFECICARGVQLAARGTCYASPPRGYYENVFYWNGINIVHLQSMKNKKQNRKKEFFQEMNS